MHWKIDIRKSTQSCLLKFCVLLFIITFREPLSLYTKAEDDFAKDCRNMNKLTECDCESRRLSYKIICPKSNRDNLFDANIEITFPLFHNYVEIYCWYQNGSMSALPNALNIGYTKTVKINFCTLAPNTSMADLFTRFNLRNVSILHFTNFDKNLNLRPQQMIGLQNLTQLSLNLQNTAPLDEKLFAELSNLKTLKLRTSLTEIPNKFLAPLTNLELLELYLYNVNELPTDIFHSNVKLLSLSISQSNFTTLWKDLFKQQTTIKTLIIFDNKFLTTIEANIFDELSNLSDLSFNYNSIYEFPAALLSHTKNLKTFSFTNKRGSLRVLPSNFLANLPNLRSVSINCNLGYIEADIFANSTIIESLKLEENQLEILPHILFQHQVNLVELDLSKNLLKTLSGNLFAYNTKLKVLKLSNNKLKQISSLIFKSLVFLESLLLDNNQIKSIDGNAFAGQTELKTLNLQNNHLQLDETLESSPFHKLRKVAYLNLRNNRINSAFFDNNFVQNDLEMLDISYNNLTKINLNNLQSISKKIIEINLRKNRIGTIIYEKKGNMNEAFRYMKIRLNLEENPFNCDCQLLGFLEIWKTQIRLQNLTCDQPALLKHKQLHQLILEDLVCEAKICPFGCHCFERTEVQVMLVECHSLSEDTIKNLSSFMNSKHLEFTIKHFELIVENRNITKLPKLSTVDFGKITTLKLAGNKIEKLDVENLPRSLSNLDLRSNNLKTLSIEIFEHFSKENANNILQLSGNPWQCDCSAKPMLEFIQKYIKTVIDKEEIYCSNVANVSFSHLHISDICQMDKLLIIGLTILVIIVIFFVILVFLYMKFNLEIKIWLYSHKYLLWLVTEAEIDKDKIFDAFISYSSKDEGFVVELVSQLENGTPPFKLCVHYRNFRVGESIPSNIANAVEHSRRTIIVLSKNFIESDWALHEFRSAHLAALEEKKPRVIVILYGDVGHIDNVDAELQAYLKTKTYLAWGDPKFWDRLRYALPHTQHLSNELAMNSIQNGYAIVNRNNRNA